MTVLRKLIDGSRPGQIFAASLICLVTGIIWLKSGISFAGLAIATLPIAVLIVLKLPFYFVLGFVLFSFFRLHEVFPQLYPLRIPQLLAISSLVSLSWALWSGSIKAYLSRELGAFLVLFALVSTGVIFAFDRGAAMSSYTGTYIKIAIMVFAICWLTTGMSQIKQLSRSFILSGILVGGVALQNKAKGLNLVEGTRVTIGRDIGSILGDPNDLSLVLLFPAGFALSYALNRGVGLPTRILAITSFVIVIAAIIATQSRGGLLGIMAVAGVFAYRRVKSKALLAIAGAALLLVLFAVAGVDDRASGGAHEQGIDESAMGRLHAWSAAFRMGLHNPFTGVGINNFIENYWSYSNFWDGQNHAVHSTWFGVFAESGVLGFTAFVTMTILILRAVLKSLKIFSAVSELPDTQSHREGFALAEALLASLAGFAVSGTFLTMGFTWPIYILLALATVLGKLATQFQQGYSGIRPKPQIEGPVL